MGEANYRNPSFLKKALMFLLGSSAIVSITAIAMTLLEYARLSAMPPGSPPTQAGIGEWDLYNYLAKIQMLLFWCIVNMFLLWFYRSHGNLLAFKVHNLKYSAKWAIWGFVIPILNLVRPYQVMMEVWRASDPDSEYDHDYIAEKYQSGTLFIKIWWGLLVISLLVGAGFGIRFNVDVGTISGVLIAMRIQMIYAVIGIMTTIASMVVVYRVSARQEAKAAMLGLYSSGNRNGSAGYGEQ